MYVSITLKITQTETKATRTEDYFAVFNSTTLGALQRMNPKKCGFIVSQATLSPLLSRRSVASSLRLTRSSRWRTKQAIRGLSYGASSKVAIKFKTPWWQVAPFSINKGGLSKTDLPLRLCVYPSYNIKSDLNPEWNQHEPSVLLCSYTWGQDASRRGSLITPDSPAGEEQLRTTLLHNLALLHANEQMSYETLLQMLNEQFVTHHAWDWYKDQNTAGAFAYFGPGQFSNMWQEIIKPNAFGQLYVIGEAASVHHGWVVGALESVLRAVYVMLEGLHNANPGFTAYRDAMRLLETEREDWLPFYLLPLEMPMRPYPAEGGPPPADLPGKAVKNEGDGLSYACRLAMLCQIESLFESFERLDFTSMS